MDTLSRIDIKGYKSIRDASIPLERLNVLIGANGTGKSNFISFLKLLNEAMAGRLQQHVAAAGRAQSLLHFGPKATPQIEAELEFAVPQGTDWYRVRLFYAPGDALFFAEESLRFLSAGHVQPRETVLGPGHQETLVSDRASGGDKLAQVIRGLLNECRVYHFHDTSPTAAIRQRAYVHDNRWLMPDAGNLAALLHRFQKKNPVSYGRILATVRMVIPEFESFELEPSRLNPNDIFLNWRKRGYEYLFGPHQLSDGSLRVIAMIALLLQPEEELPGMIVLDEPELGLHPHALEIVSGLMRAASVRSQIVVATQSLGFLNHFQPSEIITVRSTNGQSVFERLDATALGDWLRDYSLGELWERNVIGAGPLP